MRKISLFSAALVLVVAGAGAAQQPRELTAEDYARAERFLGATASGLVSGLGVEPHWLPDGRFWYRTMVPGGSRFFLVDPETRTRAAAFDETRLAEAMAAVTGGQVDPLRLPFRTFELSRDRQQLTVELPSGRWHCDLQTYRCAAADTTAAIGTPPENSAVSPDGTRAAFIRDHNLWFRDLRSGQDIQLTSDGVPDFGYATNNAGWDKSERPVVLWSPDSRRIATFQHDGRGVSNMYLVQTRVGEPVLEAWKYPLPGDSVIFRIHRVIIDVESRSTVRLQMPPDQHRSTITDHIATDDGDLVDAQWYSDGSHLAFVSSSRDHKQAILRVANATTGAVRDVVEERSPTQFQSGFAGIGHVNWRVLPASNEVLWWSQRDNWGHLYLHDLTTGRLKRQVTSGEWNVADVLRVDEAARVLYFVGMGRESGRDPYFGHLYRIGLDGRNLRLLSPENANHRLSFSPDGRTLVDTWSTPTTPPVSVIRDLNGRVILELERADVSRLLATGWRPPTPFTVKARDGRTDLYGLMYTPSNLDSTRKYPIVNRIYPGPWGSSVATRNFSPARGDNAALAELGFVVVEIDGMGTEFRSKAFHDAYYGNMADNTLPDQVAGMRQLAERYPFIDIDRAGIWGHSGGGFATAGAMFRYPEFFKVGVSQSGNHDNRSYEDDWGERFQGLLEPASAPTNYDSQANQLVASNLRGRLLITHGGMDDNVPPYNTYLVVNALIAANKDFDLLIVPNARHGYAAVNNYVMRRRWDYFVRHLLGAEPPREYEIGRRTSD